MKDIHFYSAYVCIRNQFEAEVKEAEIETIHDDGTIQLLYDYYYEEGMLDNLYGGNSGHELDKEFPLFDGTAYYSTDVNKCIDFILRKIKERNKLIESQETIRNSKLEIKLLEEGK